MRVLIDAGHGIETPFKQSPDGRFKEYLWNRQVADLLHDVLVKWFVPCSLLVPETNDVPLRTRVNRVNTLCNKVGAENVLLVSIHSNMQGNGDRWRESRGWCCYTSRGQTASDDVAECLYLAFEDEFKDRKIRKDLTDGDKDFEADFYILAKSRCKAVLLENFFYDNKEEMEWLLEDRTKERIARAAARGIYHYLYHNDKL